MVSAGGGGRLVLPSTIEHIVLHLKDNNSGGLLEVLEEVVARVEEVVEGGAGVLVHCQAGLSRSPAVVVAYLVRWRGMGVEEALALVREGRPRARPRETLMEELHTYHSRVHQDI